MSTSETLVVPGDVITHLNNNSGVPGYGTYALNGHIYASVVGTVKISTVKAILNDTQALGLEPSLAKRMQGIDENTNVYSVEQSMSRDSLMIPTVGSIVTGKIIRITPLAAMMSIIVIDGRPCGEQRGFRGTIRKEQIRETEVDKVNMQDCFRPGDIVRAAIVGLGDMRSYLASTARVDLGVVYAVSEDGVPMEALSWEEMRCPETHKTEHRKVARMGF